MNIPVDVTHQKTLFIIKTVGIAYNIAENRQKKT